MGLVLLTKGFEVVVWADDDDLNLRSDFLGPSEELMLKLAKFLNK